MRLEDWKKLFILKTTADIRHFVFLRMLSVRKKLANRAEHALKVCCRTLSMRLFSLSNFGINGLMLNTP
jgi:hypothetical protein